MKYHLILVLLVTSAIYVPYVACSPIPHDSPICLIKLNKDPDASYNDPNSYWMFTKNYPSAEGWSGERNEQIGLVFYKASVIFQAQAASAKKLAIFDWTQADFGGDPHPVYAHFYNNDGKGDKTVAFATYEGFAYHFIAGRNENPGYPFVSFPYPFPNNDGGGGVTYYTIGSQCVYAEYAWPYSTASAQSMELAGIMVNMDIGPR